MSYLTFKKRHGNSGKTISKLTVARMSAPAQIHYYFSDETSNES